MLALQAGGRGFESRHVHQPIPESESFGEVAAKLRHHADYCNFGRLPRDYRSRAQTTETAFSFCATRDLPP